MTGDELAAIQARHEQATSAVNHGAVWEGFDGPSGVTKDEALEYAAASLADMGVVVAELSRLRASMLQLADELAESTWNSHIAEMIRRRVGDNHR